MVVSQGMTFLTLCLHFLSRNVLIYISIESRKVSLILDFESQRRAAI